MFDKEEKNKKNIFQDKTQKSLYNPFLKKCEKYQKERH